MALIEEARRVWATQADKIWPGASKVRPPLIYVGETEEYAIGFTQPLSGFKDAAGVAGVQVRAPRGFDADTSAFLKLDGIGVVVMGRPEALKVGPESWVITACHEMFHGYQGAQGGEDKTGSLGIGTKEDVGAWQLTFPFPYRDADVMRLIHLQGYLLWLAFNGASEEDAKYNVGSAVEAARVYKTRLDGLRSDGKAHRYSLAQEWSEGVAAYVEFKIAQAVGGGRAGGYQPTEAFAKLPEFRGYAGVWKDSYEGRGYLVKHAGRATKSRLTFYHLGMGKALALDAVLPGWKIKYFRPGVWLDDLLSEAIQ